MGISKVQQIEGVKVVTQNFVVWKKESSVIKSMRIPWNLSKRHQTKIFRVKQEDRERH